MKENVILINTSRGGVVDELAILNALKIKNLRCWTGCYGK